MGFQRKPSYWSARESAAMCLHASAKQKREALRTVPITPIRHFLMSALSMVYHRFKALRPSRGHGQAACKQYAPSRSVRPHPSKHQNNSPCQLYSELPPVMRYLLSLSSHQKSCMHMMQYSSSKIDHNLLLRGQCARTQARTTIVERRTNTDGSSDPIDVSHPRCRAPEYSSSVRVIKRRDTFQSVVQWPALLRLGVNDSLS